jgi:hypothetical protein
MNVCDQRMKVVWNTLLYKTCENTNVHYREAGAVLAMRQRTSGLQFHHSRPQKRNLWDRTGINGSGITDLPAHNA